MLLDRDFRNSSPGLYAENSSTLYAIETPALTTQPSVTSLSQGSGALFSMCAHWVEHKQVPSLVMLKVPVCLDNDHKKIMIQIFQEHHSLLGWSLSNVMMVENSYI